MKKASLLILSLMFTCALSAQKITKSEDGTSISIHGKPVLTYVHTETLPPEGVDPLYKRSAYIHPLWSPGGEILTRIQPPDHYHHYGIWSPWTRTRVGEKEVDFWNLGAGQGTVRFVEYLDQEEAEDHAKIKVLHHHVMFNDDGTETVAINEKWAITVRPINENQYMVDLDITLNSPLEDGILFEAYRYGGGLGYRATEKWGSDNSTVLTSEGKTRIDADATGARWVIIEGETSVQQGRSGILFLSHPKNHSHPEPVRMWTPDSQDGIGNMFFDYTPIRHKEWKLEKDRDYALKYRMVVFDGKMGKNVAENYWNTFAAQ